MWTRPRAGSAARRRCPTSSASTATTCGWRAASASARPGYYSMAGFDGVMPASIPTTYDDIHAVDVRRRRAPARSSTSRASTPQVLYPNVGGFGNGYFLRLGDRELVAAVRARLQRLPHRLVQRRSRPAARRSPRCRSGTSTLAVARDRSAASSAGHRAVNFCNQPQDYGQPPLAHPHWDPIWAAAQEAGVSVSFHVGGGSMGTQFVRHRRAWAG